MNGRNVSRISVSGRLRFVRIMNMFMNDISVINRFLGLWCVSLLML